ncbi:MAG: hypothetical protein ACRDYC_09315, partial [Acidimicrobiales bacterium]
MPTRRGLVVIMGAVFCLAAAAPLGVVELYAFGVAGAVAALSAWAWVRVARWDVAVTRALSPARVPAGQHATVAVSVTNQDKRRSPVLGLMEAFVPMGSAPPRPPRWWQRPPSSTAAFQVAPLEPGEENRSTYRLPTRERGVFSLGPLGLQLRDPFGLAQVSRVVAPVTRLVVHPAVVDLHGPAPSGGSLVDRLEGGPLLT